MSRLQEVARPLEYQLYRYLIDKDKEAGPKALDALLEFQNEDGGFGQGLEQDFRMPQSSPMATSVGLRYLVYLEDINGANEAIQKAIHYLEQTYDQSRKGWYIVSEKVNDYPHAPWWHADEETGHTVLDKFWGNPSAELIGYIYRYKDYLEQLDEDACVQEAIDRLHQSTGESDHEWYCYLRLYHQLPTADQEQMYEPLKEGIHRQMVTDEREWKNYVPGPLRYIMPYRIENFGISMDLINKHKVYLMRQLDEKGVIEPTWSWQQYEKDWQIARLEWMGTLTLEAVLGMKTCELFPKIM